MNYTNQELQQLHNVLYDILGEIIRVCDLLNIPYFIIGGTAIGAFYWKSIIPWDDDIDIGMTRKNYERFLREAPSILEKGFFLQWFETDYHTPHYFAKVMREGTIFIEKDFKDLDVHRGIYIDIFPFDKVPDNKTLQAVHRIFCNFWNCCFMAKEVWMWKHICKCDIEEPTNRSFFPCLATWGVTKALSKRSIYRILSWCQGYFNNGKHKYYNMVLMPRDHISVQSINTPQRMSLGPHNVWAPSDIETYLRSHYNNLRKHLPKDEQINHRPIFLSFKL